MANEGVIKVDFPVSGLGTLTAKVLKPDDTVREASVALTDSTHDYLYTNSGAINIEAGDTIQPLLSGASIGAAQEYQSELAVAGFTVGGSMTVGTLYKILAAWIKGTLRLKEDETKIYETLDADDDATVVLTSTLDAETSPHKQVT